jgi:hypothetical protein
MEIILLQFRNTKKDIIASMCINVLNENKKKMIKDQISYMLEIHDDIGFIDIVYDKENDKQST